MSVNQMHVFPSSSLEIASANRAISLYSIAPIIGAHFILDLQSAADDKQSVGLETLSFSVPSIMLAPNHRDSVLGNLGTLVGAWNTEEELDNDSVEGGHTISRIEWK